MTDIASALDRRHAEAQDAYAAKDLDRYMAIFSPDLTYRPLNGTVLSREQLRKDVARQFARVGKVESRFARQHLDDRGSDVVEHLTQTAIAEERILFVFKRTWKLHRRGIYTWTLTEKGYVISRVEILEESLR